MSRLLLLLLFPAVAIAEPKAGEEREFEIAKGVKMKFCWIPAGKATLGSPEDEAGRHFLEKEHVLETKGFWLGKYEVTQGEWNGLMGEPKPPVKPPEPKDAPPKIELPSKIAVGPALPIDEISWKDCQKFIEKCGVKGMKVRLPNEDEWEYACRGGKGNKNAFYWGGELNGDKANCNAEHPYGTKTKGMSPGKVMPVGSFEKIAPHPWGLCDMHGNVSEWCDNFYDEKSQTRSMRGGHYFNDPELCRAACRNALEPARRFWGSGFRLALIP
ncbi:formylglycine-generating enzyme family protein [Zavarzinella formosa]|uniref:formylglycine-generating enzyme family protein n=1 Tax=Zavarzinella formosa TaxID=360055 RepID=UPI0002D6E7CC|nr:formylglycine-generating enzyme family protein [Zavarzinella formosa]